MSRANPPQQFLRKWSAVRRALSKLAASLCDRIALGSVVGSQLLVTALRIQQAVLLYRWAAHGC